MSHKKSDKKDALENDDKNRVAAGYTKFGFSLSRIWKHYKNKNFGIISAYQGSKSKSENEERNIKLKKMLREKGYGFKEIKGAWRPDVNSPVEFEYALFVPEAKKKDLIELATGFEQDAVIYTHDNNIILDFIQSPEENRVFNKLETNFEDSWIAWSEYKRHKFRFGSVVWDMVLPVEVKNWFQGLSLQAYLKDESVYEFKRK